MTTRSAACSWATRGAALPRDWNPAPRPLPSPLHTTALAAGSAAPTGAKVPSPTHMPSPDKAGFPVSRSLSCCAPPLETLLSRLFGLAGPFCCALPGFLVEGRSWEHPWP